MLDMHIPLLASELATNSVLVLFPFRSPKNNSSFQDML